MMLQILEELQLISQSPQRTTDAVLQSAYAIWAKRYPEWAAAFFDEHFLQAHVMPRFSAGQTPTAAALAVAWVTQMGMTPPQSTELVGELTPVAADFLYIVTSERSFFAKKADQRWQWVRWLAAQLDDGSGNRRVKGFS